MASGTLVVTTSQQNALVHVSLAWTATSGGAVSGQPAFSLPIGYLRLFYYSSTTATDALTQALTDVNGVSILSDGGGGVLGTIADGDASFQGVPLVNNKAASAPSPGAMLVGLYNPYTLVVAGAGTSTSAVIDLYIERIV